FRDALAAIGLNDKSRVGVDEQAFRGKGLPNVKEAVFRFPRAVGVSRVLVLRPLLSQANATYELRGARAVIGPYRRGVPPTVAGRDVTQPPRTAPAPAPHRALAFPTDDVTPAPPVSPVPPRRRSLTRHPGSGCCSAAHNASESRPEAPAQPSRTPRIGSRRQA